MTSRPKTTLVTIAHGDPSVIARARNVFAYDRDVSVVSEAVSFETAMYQLADIPTDVFAFSLMLSGGPYNSGFAGVKAIRRDHPTLRMIAWVDGCSHASISTALSIGVEGISTVAAIGTELRRAVSALRRGRHYVSPQLQRIDEERSSSSILSTSESQVLSLVHAGLSVSEIAELHDKTPSTVSKQKEAALLKVALDTPRTGLQDMSEYNELLSQDEREVIELVRLGFTTADIARICNRPANAISKQKQSALLKLTVDKVTRERNKPS
ncbi:hypothetical protein EN794_034780 [Mesorhizobium sp. M00.F.Ca.ET.151.01.1.1]|nr:hypothetical protein EN842_25525 [bacterium M00.F.Ca.ET.199.01.1.1]TGT01734.1 hypothetical protein EN820_29670 [bacterium M00.F.Ca.ET.177.01.1.1]TGT59076.1 hypothetical protein EN813_030215 [Mesorhizobium sp. M00.F.Ca.ET.170.01.1.1]TGU11104.1 hypothetical protein EN806_24945 [bacterium M00.F.Ca.ET.163.01.1.1]TGU92744.1 hypothetical protein EN794_034780 [Mesorhizobium sp. M00.F.Ca.ET.151.01.1.1]TGV54700.1 hypothetical protein EN784_34295 [bacterium M00.F.Ca.ET.141.01.1.1]